MVEGFTADVDSMDRAARWPDGSLPRAIEKVRDPISKLIIHEGLAGPIQTPEARNAEATYKSLCEVLADMQESACSAMGAIAEALREVVDLYRRVDGRV